MGGERGEGREGRGEEGEERRGREREASEFSRLVQGIQRHAHT